MTQRISIIILFLVTVLLGSNNASAGRLHNANHKENQVKEVKSSDPAASLPQGRNMPVFPASKPEAPHSKTAHAPQMEELPHINRYHKERVKKVKKHHSKLWFLGQALVVICQLTLLLIAYMHIIH